MPWQTVAFISGLLALASNYSPPLRSYTLDEWYALTLGRESLARPYSVFWTDPSACFCLWAQGNSSTRLWMRGGLVELPDRHSKPDQAKTWNCAAKAGRCGGRDQAGRRREGAIAIRPPAVGFVALGRSASAYV